MSKRYLQSDLRFGITDAMIEAVKNVINPKSKKSIDGEESGEEEEKDEKPKINRMKKAEHMKEALIGNQTKLDKNHNGHLDKQDFEMLRGKKKIMEATVPPNHKQALINHYGPGRVTVKKKDGIISHTDKYGETNSHAYNPNEKQPIGHHIGTITVGEEVEFSEAEIARIEAIAKSI